MRKKEDKDKKVNKDDQGILDFVRMLQRKKKEGAKKENNKKLK
ncbi:hypothetical protein ACFL16_00195 [Patescibacteria group bacterium]